MHSPPCQGHQGARSKGKAVHRASKSHLTHKHISEAVIQPYLAGSVLKSLSLTTCLLQGLVVANVEPNCANSGAAGRSPSGALTSPVLLGGKRDGKGAREARQKTLITPVSCSEQARYSLSLNTAQAATLNWWSPTSPSGEVPSPSSTSCSPDLSSIWDWSSTLLRPSHNLGIPRNTTLCKRDRLSTCLAFLPQLITHLMSLHVCIQWELSCQPCIVQVDNISQWEPPTSFCSCLFTLQSWVDKKGMKCCLATICKKISLDFKDNALAHLCPSLAHKLGLKKVNKFEVSKDLLQKLRCQQWHWTFRDFHHWEFELEL